MNPTFVILETKIVNGRLLVYGGLVWHGQKLTAKAVATFTWFTLTEWKEKE